jgi:ketosteroid isomerase-like protein
MLSGDCAVHHLAERVRVLTGEGPQVAWALSTNVYVKTAQGWRLAAHHASPAAAQEPAAMGGDAPGTLH